MLKNGGFCRETGQSSHSENFRFAGLLQFGAFFADTTDFFLRGTP
jgi:hypothetical protein